MPSFVNNAVPADCMALQSARTYVVKCMTKFGSHINVTQPPNWSIFQENLQMVPNKNVSVLVDILLKCVPRGLIENESVIVQEWAWHRTITSH